MTRRGRVRTGIWMLAALAAAGACDTAPDRDAVERAVEDSAGVEVVTLRGALEDLPLWGADVRERLVDGALPPYLGSVGEVAWLEDGRLAVEDDQSRVLHLFGADGRHLRVLGGRGGGPGEFQGIATLSVGPGDSLYAYDLRQQRMTVLHPEVGMVRSISFTAGSGEVGVQTRARAVWALAPDRFLAHRVVYEPGELTAGYGERGHHQVLLTLHDGEGRPLEDSLAYTGGFSASLAGDAAVPFSNQPFTAPGSEGIAYGSGLPWEVRWASGALEPQRILRWPELEEPVSEEEVEAVRQAILDAWFPRSPEVAQRLAEVTLASHLIPEPGPAVGRVLTDAAGRLWVADFEPNAPGPEWHGRWLVLEASGRPVARLELPQETRLVTVRGDRALLVVSDSLGVQHLEVATVGGP